MVIKDNCRYFRGDMPCKFHKEKGVDCEECEFYSMINKRILIIKLGAMGDVLRTTCVIPKIKEKFPLSYITWITKAESFELLASNMDIDELWSCNNTETLSRLQIQKWDCVYNLDNSHESSALASIAHANSKKGFILSKEGRVISTNDEASEWLKMAISDKVKKENNKSYQEIIYEICGFQPPISKPSLSIPNSILEWANHFTSSDLVRRREKLILIGINTGSGKRWPKKMIDQDKIVEVSKRLLRSFANSYIFLLGGPEEVVKNNYIVKKSNSARVINAGCNHSLLQFSAIVKQCDAILCGDTLALHIASGLEVPTVALFGPTSSAEIYDYNGLIKKINAEIDCLCCYGNCHKSDNCMSLISVERIIRKIKEQLNFKKTF